jgi:hypothetical protein
VQALVRQRLQAALPLADVDWNLSLQGITPPRVVLTRVSVTGGMVAGGDDGLRRARVQVDCYAATYAAACVMAQSVVSSLHGWRDIPNKIQGAFMETIRDLPPETGSGEVLGRVSVDFIIHYRET